MTYFLGVDGGQSSTKAVIGDENGRILGAGAAGPCNHVGAAGGREKLIRAVSDSVTQACQQAGLELAQVRFQAACFGMSGGPADKQAALAEILPANQLVVTHDASIALSGATEGEPGVITIAGTGSIAFGRNAANETARAGGWGYLFGDEGGGFDITRQALRAALRMEEGWGPHTDLRQALMNATGASDANDLLHRFYTSEFPRPRIASFAKIVDETARAGDLIAIEILHNAAQQLASLTSSVRNQLWQVGQTIPVAYAGGAFQSEILLDRFRLLVELDSGNRCQPPRFGPAAGALIEAYRAAGIRPKLKVLPEMEL